MADRDVSFQNVKFALEAPQRSQVLTQIRSEVDRIRDHLVKGIEEINESVIGGLDQHLKESAHAKLDGHLKTSQPGDIYTQPIKPKIGP